MDDGYLARDVTVRGMVQGVAFRWTTLQRAEQQRVTGWVRNETDGSVQAHLEGSPDAVANVIAWMRHGPSGADVEALEERQSEIVGHRSFDVH